MKKAWCAVLFVMFGAASSWAAITITPSNLDQSLNEDFGTKNINIHFSYISSNGVPSIVTPLSISGSPVLFSATVIDGIGADQVIRLTSNDDLYGTNTVTLIASNSVSIVTNVFDVVVTPVNDAPEFTSEVASPVETDEDIPTSALSFAIFDIDNVASNLTITKTSSDTTLLPLSNIVIGGNSSNRTVTITPAPDENGSSDVELILSDGEFSVTNLFSVDVEPVNDPPTFSGVISNFSVPDTAGSTNIFGTVSIDDVDQGRPNDEILTLTVSASPANAEAGNFEVMVAGLFSDSGIPTNIQQVIRGLDFSTIANAIPVGSNEVINVTVIVEDGDGVAVTNTSQITIQSVNDAPTAVFEVNPGRISDDLPVVAPFDLDVTDPDIGDVLTVQLWANNLSLGELSPENPGTSGSVTDVENYINNVQFYPVEDVLTGLTNVIFTLTISDGDVTITNTAVLEILPANNPPSVTGVALDLIRTDNDTPVTPFEDVVISDADLGGLENLTVTLSVDRPQYGLFSESTFTDVPANVTAWIKTVQFIPTNTTIAVGDTETVTLTITVQDSTATVINSLTHVVLIGVDGVPQIIGIPAIQPKNVVPEESPFLGIQVLDTSGSTNLTLTIEMDNMSKGSLSNTVISIDGFVSTNTTLSAINTLLSNLVFVANDSYLFPPGQYGDTTFTITVVNEQGRMARKTLHIILQDRPRNIMVTRSDDDDQPGSLRYALDQAVHNDVITFAFTNNFPVIIRLEETVLLSKHLTFKGPGADKLILSGDVNGDGVPDNRLFRVESVVLMEGIALEHGIGLFGGAVSIGPTGGLTMRYCRISDSVALLWGGAVDVDEGWLVLENCLLQSNSTDAASGLGGGAVSIYTDQDCFILNTTFSGNRQDSVAGYGGGAIYVENVTPSTYLNVDLIHCTFSENEDVSGTASSAYVNGFGSTLWPLNSIFADGFGRNLEVDGAGWILSGGGNISDDSTYTDHLLGGGTGVYLLDDDTDQTNTNAMLGTLAHLEGPTAIYPLLAGSPAMGAAEGMFTAIDQRGVFRLDAQPDSGAVEYGALQRVVINEIQSNDDPDDFIELYIPRDSVDTDLTGYSLWVDGTNIYNFSSTVIKPGAGIIVAASTNVTAVGPPATPVVVPSINPLVLGEEGEIVLMSPNSQIVLEVLYNTSFMTISNVFDSLAYTNHSATLSPQFHGFAYLPHGRVGSGVSSAGYDTKPQAFGSPNASALAIDDRFVVGEDVISWLDVLANDIDADRTDTLIVTGVPAPNQTGTTVAGANYSVSTNIDLLPDGIWYNPLVSSNIQQLAEGDELTEMLSYSIADMGGGSVALIELSGGSNLLHTAEDHRLTTNDTVILNDTTLYDGEAAVLMVVDEDTVVLDLTVAGSVSNGNWSVLRTADQADVELTVIGINDAPIASNDTVQCGEEDVLRILANPDYLGSTNILFETDADYLPVTVDLASTNLLGNDTDIDSDDDNSTLKVVGIVSSISELNAGVTLEIRSDRAETSIIYNPRVSSILNGLAAGESTNDTFRYVVMDSHGALGTGTVTVVVSGVNDLPVRMDDPNNLDVLRPFITGSNTVADVITNLIVLDAVTASSGTSDRTDARIIVGNMSEADSLTLSDLWTTTEDEQLAIVSSNIWANDLDVDLSDQLAITNVFTSQLGVPVFLTNSNLSVVYDAPESSTLNALARGELVIDSFDVVISDGNSGLITNTVAVLVIGVNDTPVAEDDALDTFEDVSLVFDPTTNHPTLPDSDVDINGMAPDNAFWIVPVQDEATPQYAVFSISNNIVTYDPSVSAGAEGTAWLDGLSETNSVIDEFTYTLTDQSFVFACDDVFRVEANGSALELAVMANDRNYNQRGGVISILTNGLPDSGGTIEINTNNTSLIYTPQTGFVGDEIFTYTITDPWGNIDRARVTVRVTVERFNGNIQANEDYFSVAVGEEVVLNVLANDNRLPLLGTQLSIIQLMTNGLVGTVQQVGNALVYSNTNGAMTETFDYTISAGGSSVATASVTIDVINRDNQLPVQDDCFSVLRDSVNNSFDVLINDVILPDVPAIFIQDLTYGPSYGTAVVTNNILRYTPDAGFVGIDELDYVVSDGLGGTGYGTVQIFVGSLVTQNDTFTAVPDGASIVLDVLANDTILPATTSGEISITGISTNILSIGTISNANSHLVFTSYLGSNGTSVLTYTVEDGSLSGGRTAQGSVTLITGSAGTHANPDHVAVLTESDAVVLEVLNNDEPRVAGRTLVITSIGTGIDAPNRGGSVEPSVGGGSLIYTPASGFVGEETFTYVMSDSLGTDSAKVVVQVRPSEIAVCDDIYTVYFTGTNTPSFTLPVLLNDDLLPDSGTLTITGTGMDDPLSANAPNYGGYVEIGSDNRSLEYRPYTNYSGAFPYTETFTYEVSDGTDRRASGWISVKVQKRIGGLEIETNDDRYSVNRNSSSNVLAVLINDGILPATATGWDITSVSDCDYGGFAAIVGNVIIYTPAPDFTGTDAFTYSVSDGLGGTASADVTVIVGDILLNPDCFAVLSGTAFNQIHVLVNDGVLPGPEFDLTLHTGVSASLGGTASVASNSLFYAPNPAITNYPYVETLEYTVLDDSSLVVTQQVKVMVVETGSDRDTATVSITVQGVNDLPVIESIDPSQSMTDKETLAPFSTGTVYDVDEWYQELLNVTVTIDDSIKGSLTVLGSFTNSAAGIYAMSSSTGADITASLRNLTYVPVENRITVGTNETVTLTIIVEDPFGGTATNVVNILVTPVNDPPVISGTRAGQTVYHALRIKPFSSVAITEIDDLTLQLLTVRVALDDASHGILISLGVFTDQGGGIYSATNLTYAEATVALRSLIFEPTTNGRLSSSNLTETTRFTISVDDHFAAPVVSDDITTVTAMFALVGEILKADNINGIREFGAAVGAVRDWVAAGAPDSNVSGDDEGAVVLFSRNLGGPDAWGEWMTLLPPDPLGSDQFGYAVAMSGDTLVVGAPDHAGKGAAYVFQQNQDGTNAWGFVKKLIASDGSSGNSFGYSVSIDGDTIAVGDIKEEGVYLFDRHAGGSNQWSQAQKVVATGGTFNRDFGYSVSLHGDSLIVGAPIEDGSVDNSGAAYVFKRSAGVWSASQTLVSTNTGSAGRFGFSVDIYDDLLVVGAPFDNNSQGAAFIFENTGNVVNPWVLEKTLVAPVRIAGDQYGAGVTIDRDLVVIGADTADTDGEAWLYGRHEDGTNQWGRIDHFNAPAGNVAGEFGSALALDDYTLAIGSSGTGLDSVSIYRLRFNDAPVVAEAIGNQTATVFELFELTVPASTFADPDIEDALTLTATQANGSSLSTTWLSFDSNTGLFSGTPVATGSVEVLLIATDMDELSATNAFTVYVVSTNGTVTLPTIVQWKVDNFGVAALADPYAAGEDWSDTADSDLDGLSNMAEYIFGTDPTVYGDLPAHELVIVYDAGLERVTVSYNRRTNDSSLTYVLEISNDLLSWQDASPDVSGEVMVPLSAGMERVIAIFDGVDLSAYFRIHVAY